LETRVKRFTHKFWKGHTATLNISGGPLGGKKGGTSAVWEGIYAKISVYHGVKGVTHPGWLNKTSWATR